MSVTRRLNSCARAFIAPPGYQIVAADYSQIDHGNFEHDGFLTGGLPASAGSVNIGVQPRPYSLSTGQDARKSHSYASHHEGTTSFAWLPSLQVLTQLLVYATVLYPELMAYIGLRP